MVCFQVSNLTSKCFNLRLDLCAICQLTSIGFTYSRSIDKYEGNFQLNSLNSYFLDKMTIISKNGLLSGA